MELTLVDVYADVVCPFAYVGLSRFIAERTSRGRDDVVLCVKAWPLEWVNNGPMDGHAVAEKGAVLRSAVAPDLFARVDAERYPTTSLAALELTAFAYEHDPRVGERVAMELRRRLFDEGADIGDPAVVAAVAASFGLSVPNGDARVRAQYDEGKARGVKGSPHSVHAPLGWWWPRWARGLVMELNLQERQCPPGAG